MTSKMRRLLSLALCAVMLCSLLPGIQASATGTTTPIHPRAITENDYGGYQINTFEDLKELAAGSYSDWINVFYDGGEELVISENLTIPENLSLDAYNTTIIIPEGVTLTTNGYVSTAGADVAGTWYSSGGLQISEKLNITGSVYIDNSADIESSAEIIGEDKITYANPYTALNWLYRISDFSEMKAVVNAANTASNPHYSYSIYQNNDAPIVINESITLPDNTNFIGRNNTTVTVSKGCTLTLDCWSSIRCDLIVEGTLVNNNFINVYGGGTITLSGNGAYEGNGTLMVDVETLTSPADALPGFDLTNFEVTRYDEGYAYWELKNIAGLTKLGTPTDLEWGYAYEGEKIERPGSMIWKPTAPDQAEVEIKVYKEGETTPVGEYWWGYGSMEMPEYRDADSFCKDDMESGTYYFTVKSRGDYVQYADSEVAVSDTWTYVKPDAKLSAPTTLTWNWPEIYVEAADQANLGGYEVEYYYAPTADAEPQHIGGSWSYYPDGHFRIWDEAIQENGIGYYYFKTRALSADITAACNSDWSNFSEAYYLDTKPVSGQLNDIVNSGMSDEEILDAVQSLDTQELKDAMLADGGNSGAVNTIAQLEAQVGGPAPVEVSQEAAAFDANEISIVGANLNNTDASGEPIKLVIDKPEKENIIPAQYDNSVAVKFSMDLDNVEDSKNLDVPVKITLPVPATINPDFLVILHYHADGSVEELWPHIYQEGGKYYAAFVLTSFSDFVMTEYVGMSFTDVPADAWYAEAVAFVSSAGLMNGTGDGTTFAPNDNMTRAMVATILYRIAGTPSVDGMENPFSDVAAGQWYTNAIIWAANEGVVKGTSDTTFAPNMNVTREQLVLMMWRFFGAPASDYDLSAYPDAASVSSWVEDSVAWAVENGVISGTGDGRLAPQDNASRAMFAQILLNYLGPVG